jgi:hypothetical protein
MEKPDPFLEVRVHFLDRCPSLTGLCAGFELGSWRAEQLARHLMEWLPEFALTHDELLGLSPSKILKLLRLAARNVYASEKFANRGEFGELLLHVAVRQVFDSQPAISKIYYKSSRNETVKGFDAVHVVQQSNGLELWLGEAKFYADARSAIAAVNHELHAHTQRDYLRDEFMLITGKIDPKWEHAAELRRIISENRSLDEIFQSVRIPVLITYDSTCLANNQVVTDRYVSELRQEVMEVYEQFRGKQLPSALRIHLFLLPLYTKAELLSALDKHLRILQQL